MSQVSTIILSHNTAPYIAAAIESAVGQTHPPLEVLVVDDSTDDSADVVRACAARFPGVVRLVQVPKCNVSQARNLGLEAARGDHLAFLDADDMWLPEKTACQLAVLAATPDAVGAYSPYFDFRVELDDLQRRVPKPGRDRPEVRDILFEQNMASSTILVRRRAVGALRFDEHAPDGEDTIFDAELRLRGPWRCADKPLIAKRVHAQQASGGHWHQVRNHRTRLDWIRRRSAELGPDLARALEAETGQGLMQYLEHRYWSRELVDLKAMLAQAREMCPAAYQNSTLSRRRIYPRWVYRVRDLAG